MCSKLYSIKLQSALNVDLLNIPEVAGSNVPSSATASIAV